jgi:putative transcriptional regulator
VGTLRHWERGDRTPRGATLVLLNIIAKEPKAVMRALEAA